MPESDIEGTDDRPPEETNASCAVDGQNADPEPASDRWRKDVWASGSYSDVAPKYVSMAGRLVQRADVGDGDAVLDVGCGTGTVAVAAARRGGQVTGVDIQPVMLEHARENADIAGVEVSWREGDVTSLPFESNAFDAVLSNLGHMYGDPPDAAASELLRVTRPGGRIGFTSWTPDSPYPAMAGAAMTVLPPEGLPDFSEPPFLWGDTGTVRERLGDSVEDLEFETGTVQYPALSPEHFWEHTTTTSGMFVEALEEVDDDELPGLRELAIETIESYFDESENAVELEYLLTTATVAAPD